MDWFWILAIIIISIFVLWALISLIRESTPDNMKHAEKINTEKLEELIKESNAQGIEFRSFNNTCNAIVDEEKRELHVVNFTDIDDNNNLAFERYTCKFEDIIQSELVIDNEILHKTMRGSQVAGAAVGGLLFGGVGAIIGGTTGGTKQEELIRNIDIKLTINKLQSPIIKISFLNTFKHNPYEVNLYKNGHQTSSMEYKKATLEAEKWQGMFDVIIKNQA